MSCVSIVALASSAMPIADEESEIEDDAPGQHGVVDLLVRCPADRAIAVAHGAGSSAAPSSSAAGSDGDSRAPAAARRARWRRGIGNRTREDEPGHAVAAAQAVDHRWPPPARRRVAMGVALERRRRSAHPAAQKERPQQRARRQDEKAKTDGPFPRRGIDGAGAAPHEEDRRTGTRSRSRSRPRARSPPRLRSWRRDRESAFQCCGCGHYDFAAKSNQ